MKYLPIEIIRLIYEYDNRYYMKYKLVMNEMKDISIKLKNRLYEDDEIYNLFNNNDEYYKLYVNSFIDFYFHKTIYGKYKVIIGNNEVLI